MRLIQILTLFVALVLTSRVVETDADLIDEICDLDVLKLRESPENCPAVGLGGQCPDSNPIYYFKCCGARNTSCCFRLQDWLTVLFGILIILIIFGILINIIRCIFCF